MATDIGDIGGLLFEDILGMNYPGAPFTGNPIQDLVMFFFVPSVLLIVMLWVILQRIPYIKGAGKIKILFAMAMYLFVIFGGYFKFFALLAGPYFIILIFLIGILLFIGGHFTGGKDDQGGGDRQSSGMSVTGPAPPAGRMTPGEMNKTRLLLGMPKLPGRDKRWLEEEAKALWRGMKRMEKLKGGAFADLTERETRLAMIEADVFGHVLNESEREKRYK